jgi:hypothetical protein
MIFTILDDLPEGGVQVNQVMDGNFSYHTRVEFSGIDETTIPGRTYTGWIEIGTDRKTGDWDYDSHDTVKVTVTRMDNRLVIAATAPSTAFNPMIAFIEDADLVNVNKTAMELAVAWADERNLGLPVVLWDDGEERWLGECEV